MYLKFLDTLIIKRDYLKNLFNFLQKCGFCNNLECFRDLFSERKIFIGFFFL